MVNCTKIMGTLRAAGEIDNISMENIQAVILMFDITAQNSYESVPLWYNAIKDKNRDVIYVLIGNKVGI